MKRPNRGGQRQSLARMIEDASEHRPKAHRFHVADEYADLGNVQVAAELRRQLRGGFNAWRELLQHG